MVELHIDEDQTSFTNFLCMPPDMYDELLRRVGPRITNQDFYALQGATRTCWLEACTDLTPSSPWEQVCLNEACLESPPQHHFSTLFFLSVLLKSVNLVPEQVFFLQELEHGLLLLICETACSLPGPFLFVVRNLR